MNLFSCLKKVSRFSQDNILDMSLSEFYKKIDQYQFNFEELVFILGILLNKQVIDKTKKELQLVAKNQQEKVVIEFAVFAYIFIGDEYNDKAALEEQKIDLDKNDKDLFLKTLINLISNYSRVFDLARTLGDDNERANMFAVNTILNIRRGIGFDNFHITLFTAYQALELKLKHCLRKYVEVEPAAHKKQFNFHNLVRLIKLISTTRVEDKEMAEILKELREYLRYFEKINPRGQAARYEADPNNNYYNGSISVINEKEILQNFIHALSLLQKLYLKLLELYDDKLEESKISRIKIESLDPVLAQLIGVDLSQDSSKIDEKLRNILDQQIFGDYQELIDLPYQELINLRFLIRIGFIKYVNQAIEELLKK